MRVYVQHKPGCLIVALEGVANSIQDSLDADSALFRLIDARIRRHRPRCLMIDFRDLTLIDGSTLRSLLAHARGLASTLKVKLIGPGRALRRLQALLVHAPPVRFFPTIRAARKTFASSIEPRSGA